MSGDRKRPEARSDRASVIWLVIAFVAILGFVALTVAIKARVVFPFDKSLLAVMHGWPVDPLVWKVLTETANIPLFLIGGGFVIWLWFNKRRREALVVFTMRCPDSSSSWITRRMLTSMRRSTARGCCWARR